MNIRPATLTTAAAMVITFALAAPVGAGGYKSDSGMQKQTGAMEQQGVAEKTFSKLDTNEDGYLSKREVQQKSDLAEPRPDLIENWDQVDKNQDNQLDKSEFSAFEQMEHGKSSM